MIFRGFILCGCTFLMLNSLFCTEEVKPDAITCLAITEVQKTNPRSVLTDVSPKHFAEIIAEAKKQGLKVAVYEKVNEKGEVELSLSVEQDNKYWEIAKMVAAGAFIFVAGVAVYFALPSLVKKCLSEDESA